MKYICAALDVCATPLPHSLAFSTQLIQLYFVFEMHVHVLPLPSLYLSGTLFILKEIHHSGWKVVEINA